MNQDEARRAGNLVRETFTERFDKTRFRNFVNELLNGFDESKAQPMAVPDAFADHVRSSMRLGTYRSPDDELLDVLVVNTTEPWKLERTRSALRNFVAHKLKRGDNEKDAGLVAFVSPSEKQWRFSYVKMEYATVEKGSREIGVETKLTPARRFSYIVGEGESCHTAQTRFLGLLQDTEQDPTLAPIEEAFSVEAVTKEFFKKYAELFGEIQKALEKLAAKDSTIRKEFSKKQIRTSDFAKKLMGQIVFLYFIQKKGWMGVEKGKDWGTGPHDFLRRLAHGECGKYENFFNDILEPLFYDTLATDRGHEAWCKRFNFRIPFLNGGLFEPLADYDWRKTDIVLPNRLFTNNEQFDDFTTGTGLLDMFDRYNFTVNEAEPLEKEVAIDPEMLGKVFENLIEENLRKGLGSYYTPREIVHYMCQESLINYLDTALNTRPEIVGREKRKQSEFSDEKAEQALLTASTRREIVPRADIETFVHLGDQISHYEAVETRYAIKMPKAIEKHARPIDQKLADITICDPAVGSGAFPVGMMTEIVRARSALTPYFNDVHDRTPYHFKRHAIQNCLYGVDIDPGAVEIAKLRLWLSLVVDEDEVKQIKPLPNLFYKIVTGNSLLGVEKNLFNQQLFRRLEDLKPRYFDEPDKNKKDRYKQQIEDTIHDLTNGKEAFDFEIYFSEVFHEKGGFDVVIANPPYVKEDVNKHAFDGLRNSECYQGKMDLWYLFGCRALDILRDGGALCFIATNNWISNDGASRFRNKVILQSRIVDVLDFGNHKVFTAGIQTMVFVLVKGSPPCKYPVNYGRLLNERASATALKQFLQSGPSDHAQDYVKYVSLLNCSEVKDNYVRFLSKSVELVVEKMLSRCDFHLPDADIHSGIDVMQDFVSRHHLDRLDPRVNVGDGIFVLSNKEKRSINWNPAELELVKPYYTTGEIGRYSATSQNKHWIIYTSKSANSEINKYPNIRRHLDRFQKVITSVNKPYGLHRTRDESIFLGPKILATRKCAVPSFSLVDFPAYVSRTFLILKPKNFDLRYLLALLNSRLIAFWLFHKGKLQGNQYQVDIVPLTRIPLCQAPGNTNRDITQSVGNILAAKRADSKADVSALERKLDQLVYALYGLTPEEIKIVESATK